MKKILFLLLAFIALNFSLMAQEAAPAEQTQADTSPAVSESDSTSPAPSAAESESPAVSETDSTSPAPSAGESESPAAPQADTTSSAPNTVESTSPAAPQADSTSPAQNAAESPVAPQAESTSPAPSTAESESPATSQTESTSPAPSTAESAPPPATKDDSATQDNMQMNADGTMEEQPNTAPQLTKATQEELDELPADIVNNEFFTSSIELRKKANVAYQQGDYDSASLYAAQAKEQAILSDTLVDQSVAQHQISKAEAALAKAEKAKLNKSKPKVFEQASTELASAKSAFTDKDFLSARQHAEAVLDLLKAYGTQVLPKYYVVRKGDWLTKIAQYPFIYNSWKPWPKIYRQNKAKLTEPSNPDLILPGQILEIPSLNGEERSGTYDPAQQYPSVGK